MDSRPTGRERLSSQKDGSSSPGSKEKKRNLFIGQRQSLGQAKELVISGQARSRPTLASPRKTDAHMFNARRRGSVSTQKAWGEPAADWAQKRHRPGEHTHRQLPEFRQQKGSAMPRASCCPLPTARYWPYPKRTLGKSAERDLALKPEWKCRQVLLPDQEGPPASGPSTSLQNNVCHSGGPGLAAAHREQQELLPSPQRPLNITIPQTLGTPLLRQEPEMDSLCLPEPGALQMGFRTLLASLKCLSNG